MTRPHAKPWLHALALVALLAGGAQAHFLFIGLTPRAESGRTAEVFFSAQADAGDPEHVKNIAHATLRAQTAPGVFQPMTVHAGLDRLRAHVPGSGSVAVAGLCEYGVLKRPDSTFLLRYYPKAVAGEPDELAKLERFPELPFELFVRFENGKALLSAQVDGKVVPGLQFTTVDINLVNETLTAGNDGIAPWTPPEPGVYCVYARRSTPETGARDGQEFREVREFATIVFSWPPARDEPDTDAVRLFQEAVANRAQWVDFPGFQANIAGVVDDRPYSGKVTIDPAGKVDLTLDDPTVKSWVADQLASIIMHRQPTPANETPVLRFAQETGPAEHPLGTLLEFEGGRFASSYRIKDGRIRVVNRHLGPQNLTITVLDESRNPEGKLLPQSYLVHYWDDASGNLERTESIQETWTRVGNLDLPTSHVVTSASPKGLSVRSIELSNHALGRR
jgi:hypothetical protein